MLEIGHEPFLFGGVRFHVRIYHKIPEALFGFLKPDIAEFSHMIIQSGLFQSKFTRIHTFPHSRHSGRSQIRPLFDLLILIKTSKFHFDGFLKIWVVVLRGLNLFQNFAIDLLLSFGDSNSRLLLHHRFSILIWYLWVLHLLHLIRIIGVKVVLVYQSWQRWPEGDRLHVQKFFHYPLIFVDGAA